jgi:hypothetical protein
MAHFLREAVDDLLVKHRVPVRRPRTRRTARPAEPAH